MGVYTLNETTLAGCYEVKTNSFVDQRGKLVKIYHEESLKSLGLISDFEESYYSVSKKGTLRGLHFQLPPAAQVKLVGCISGSILDVVVDLRSNSKTFGKTFSVELSSKKSNLLYVPEGFAHGFYALSDEVIFISFNSRKYVPELDSGIKWNSIDYEWPVNDPQISEKDQNMTSLGAFVSPF